MSDATLIYDDACGFCTWAAEFVAERSDVELVGFSELDEQTRQRLPADYEDCAHLIIDGAVYSCGAAMERAFVQTDLGDDLAPVVRFLDQFDDYTRVRERLYREVADRRDALGSIVSREPPARRQDSRE
ncbi:DCC1-like thiol-disulfide oxidoreductase family protein [Halapricum desulfuricans]|uniref:Thioredoxin superfamily protein n=1 Tax=Halapricum desulfuricans TaxID=2841257 RepID=A0A897N7T5_9EURY|nr:DCC1-like thiol-disulfide oxidoreductase family protein [Halapricum desulfuricans]QSG07205.1 Thioredoxin superfamily protein [Halapricum desulfuricans]